MTAPPESPDKKTLEKTLKEKVAPLVEERMEKHWGVTIPRVESDITDQLSKPDVLCYIPQHSTFRAAKKQFKAAFLKRELRVHQGNVSELARSLDVDRRSIHRVMKDLAIDLNRLRQEEGWISEEEEQRERIDQRLRGVFEQYKELIQPQKMEKMYEEIPSLSRNIAKMLPLQHATWEEAETEFEQEFFRQALQEHQGNITQTAKCIGLRTETMHRKIRRLQIKLE